MPSVPKGNGQTMRRRPARHTIRIPTAMAAITRLAYARAKAAGIDLRPLLKKTNLQARQIEDPLVRLKVKDQIEFLNLVAGALHDDLLGFHLAQLPDLREMGLFYYVLASCDVLVDALRRVVRYGSIVNEGVFPKLIDGKNVGLSIHYVGVSRHLDRHQIEYWMTAIVRVCRQLTGLHLMPSHLLLMHHRESRAEFAGIFGEHIEFGAATDEIVFPKKVRDLPIVQADPYLHKVLSKYCEEALARQPRSRASFRSRVENAIVPLLPHGEARADEIARRLGVSQRTFVRRLSSEGLSFSKILDDLRFGLAKRYLASKDFSVSQIAWLLGYQEVSSFSHAFRRWTGQPPRAARPRLALPPPQSGATRAIALRA